jgi:uncharacterized protein with HEPN domain
LTSRDLGYLEDMRVHAADATAIASRIGRETFLSDRTMQHAVIRCLTVIGEAVGLRNVLVHEYQRIDLARVWTIVQTDLPPLLASLEMHLGKID